VQTFETWQNANAPLPYPQLPCKLLRDSPSDASSASSPRCLAALPCSTHTTSVRAVNLNLLIATAAAPRRHFYVAAPEIPVELAATLANRSVTFPLQIAGPPHPDEGLPGPTVTIEKPSSHSRAGLSSVDRPAFRWGVRIRLLAWPGAFKDQLYTPPLGSIAMASAISNRPCTGATMGLSGQATRTSGP